MGNKAWLAVFLVFLGCCSNVVFLELLVTAHPGSGNIITFAQFVVVAVEGFVNEMNFGRKENAIPLSYYFYMVVMFLSVNVLNNYALNFHIPLPLHMIFRSGSLIANLLMGILLLKKRYSLSKYLAVGCITVGICISTIASSTSKVSSTPVNVSSSDDNATAAAEAPTVPIFEWSIGIGMLTFALFASALMGIYQEKMYAKFGKHPHEALFFVHALSLPAFALMWTDVAKHAALYQASPILTVPIISKFISVPSMWAWLFGNVVTQLMCIKGVYILTSEVPSLICTLVVTLRKFFSLLFSIYYFQNPFSVYHWIGTSLVFGGTIIFLDLINTIRNQIQGSTGGIVAKKDVTSSGADTSITTNTITTTTDDVTNDVKYTELKKKE